MRTITTTVYSFNELSEDAKETAIQEFRNEGVDASHYWDEAHDSVKKFHNVIGTREGVNSWLDINTGHIEDDILNLSGLRLRTYLINNFEELFYERKYRRHGASTINEPKRHRLISRIGKDCNGLFYPVYRSNFLTESCCPLTGVCYDENLLDPFKKFIKEPDNSTFEDLLNEAMESLRISLENEEEYRNSDEAITEDIEANEYEFTEDGNRI
jgi:Fe-S cluster biosynthesis and repair protein YggX